LPILAFNHELQHLALTRSQTHLLWRLISSPSESTGPFRSNQRRHVLTPFKHFVNRGEQVLSRRLFQHVGLGSASECFGKQTIIGVHRQEYDPRGTALLPQSSNGVETV